MSSIKKRTGKYTLSPEALAVRREAAAARRGQGEPMRHFRIPERLVRKIEAHRQHKGEAFWRILERILAGMK